MISVDCAKLASCNGEANPTGVRSSNEITGSIGSAAAAIMFLTTLTFLFSTPAWEPSLGGFPALSAAVRQFLLKDIVLLGAAIWLLGEAWTSEAIYQR